MRLAVYNVENLFDRPKAMNLGTWNEGKPRRASLNQAQADVKRLTAELATLREEQAREKANLEARVNGLTERLATAQRALAECTEQSASVTTLLDRSVKALGEAENKNRELVGLNRKLIGLYRDKGVLAALAQREPVFGLRQVAVENEAEALRTEVEALRLPETAGDTPAAPAAGGR